MHYCDLKIFLMIFIFAHWAMCHYKALHANCQMLEKNGLGGVKVKISPNGCMDDIVKNLRLVENPKTFQALIVMSN
jgi:hypothetical protein